MDKESEDKRKRSDRRDQRDRRTGKFDEAYRRLVEKGIFQNSRKGDRRKSERRGTADFRLSEEEKYTLYFMGTNKNNLDRKKMNLPPEPLLSYEEWLKEQHKK